MATLKLQPTLPPLFLAAREGNLEEVKRLLALPGIDIDECTEYGNSPLHAACVKGHTKIATLLLERGASSNRATKTGFTPLHLACAGKDTDTVHMLLKNRANVNTQSREELLEWETKSETKMKEWSMELWELEEFSEFFEKLFSFEDGSTPLHIACRRGNLSIVQQLLSVPGIDMNIRDAKNKTPVMRARDYRILALLQKYMKSCEDFPVHAVTKVVLCGNTGAGKTTLAQIILNTLDPMRAVQNMEDHLRNVKPLTAGILSYYVQRSDGSIRLFDLAGHLEYYSSHSSCLEAFSQSTPSTFLTLADISAKPDDVKTQLNYWSAMIGNVCSKCPQPSEVIVLGTHADKVKDKAELDSLCHLLNRHADEAVKKSKQHFAGFIGLNVTDYQSADMKDLISQLLKANEVVRKRCPPISLSCHVLLALLTEKVPSDKAAITLSDLLQLLHTVEDHGLSTNISEITEYLTTLSDKGLIVFFPGANPSDSWIVLRQEILLEEVNGTIFAPASFPEHCPSLVSNTGIIPLSVLQIIFPKYDIKMVVQFLFHRELCQPVYDTTDASKELIDCVFFPSLVSNTRPSDITISPSSFVWKMHTSSGSEFFTPRCLHALMHRLADQFPLPSEEFIHDKEIHHFSRKCKIWSTGIAWRDKLGIWFIVEMDKLLQCLSFTASANEKQKNNSHYPMQHKRILDVIKKCCEDFCPLVAKDMKERICRGPSMEEVAFPYLKEAISSQSSTVLDISGFKEVDLEEWLQMEPQLPLLIGVDMRAKLGLQPSMQHPSVGASVVTSLEPLRECTSDHLLEIASFSFDWRRVGRRLVSSQNITDISRDEPDEPNRREAVLMMWQSQKGSSATYTVLAETFEKLQYGLIAEKVKKMEGKN